MPKDFDDIDDNILKDSPADVGKQSQLDIPNADKSKLRRTKSPRIKSGSNQSTGKQEKDGKLGSGLRATQLILWAVVLITAIVGLIWKQLYGTAFLVGSAGMIVFFLFLFTGGIDRIKMNGMVVYCYLFTASALAGSVVPFFYFDDFVFHNNQQRMHTSPLGIFKACVKTTSEDVIPPELDCKREKTQWVVNIGGTVKTIFRSTCATDECINREKIRFPERHGNNNIQISGGLVIPLYVLVFAMMGATINMARRVPEYQRQVYLYFEERGGHEPQADEISCEDAREFMVFQLMQVVAAPMIAITAYYVLVPSSSTASVVLGVVAGFASETVLITLRAIADKLLPNAVAERMKVNYRRRLESDDSR